MTMLSWSVIEYSAKYEAAGELNHVKEIIKWGSDYFLKTFNHSADSIDKLVAQVSNASTSLDSTPLPFCVFLPLLIYYFYRLGLDLLLEEVLLIMIIIAGCALRTLITPVL